MNEHTLDNPFVRIPKLFFVLSLTLHLGLCLTFVIAPNLLEVFGIKFRPMNPMVADEDFIQVDVVALPDQMISDKVENTELPITEKPAKATETKAETTQEEALLVPTKEKKGADTTTKEQEKILKRLSDEAKREATLKSLTKTTGQGRPKLAGNRLSRGTSTSGKIGTPKDQYATLLKKMIQDHFSVYSWHQSKALVAVVYLEISSTGRIRQKRFLTASPDPIYNSAVMQAVDAAEPLPVPDDLSLLNDGVRLEFRSKE